MGQLPEGRKPLTWADMTPKHSSWEAECRWHTIRAQQAIDETKALRARVEKLEAALREAIFWDDYDEHGAPAVWLQQARAALKQGDDQ